VGNVKQTGGLADGAVFVQNRTILDGHFPTGEGDDAAPVADVEVEEGGAAKGFGHGAEKMGEGQKESPVCGRALQREGGNEPLSLSF
jgi:hypothetical protein